MLNAHNLSDHWLVRAVAGFGDGEWNLIVAEPDGVLFALANGSSTEWPATVSIDLVADSDWPSSASLVADQDQHQADSSMDVDGTVRLARRTGTGYAVSEFEVRVDAALPGSPVKVEMLIDIAPRLHLVAAAAGPDMYELGRLMDSLEGLLSAVEAGAVTAPDGFHPLSECGGA